ncbi:hypothetical protein M622_13750 [Thauera terpenica 58Eu]|uniref:2Fe-2S ferredoxin-type domain-containing protein n=1 Tax=Thauera terpenica 58Eu TaxID=1348657 RepID=T0B0D3_9RHOO|nr:2Fe-2S iron-sulfur cluster-binding protein [Thauera terpenica]EPZ16288.1 hypothetical protein M622_13750 [Thauera terpenica 58Eu]
MAKITFIEHCGTPHTVDVPEGTSLMQAAIGHNIPGIDADCGGAMTCGTCLVFVPPSWAEKLEARSEHERQMLEFSGKDAANARLSCQLIACPALDGLSVQIPESQG